LVEVDVGLPPTGEPPNPGDVPPACPKPPGAFSPISTEPDPPELHEIKSAEANRM
jgi:hypothetical protein